MKHPEFEKLIARFESSLPKDEAEEIVRHLSGCAKCAAQNRKLSDFYSYANADQSEAVPQATTARLLSIFRAKKRRPAKQRAFSLKLLAKLVFDDWETAFSERYAATGDNRQLLFRADGFELDLRLNFDGGKCQLSGQVFPDCGAAATAEIFSTVASETVRINEYCEFSFSPLAEGIYNVRLTLAETVIEIENLSLELNPPLNR
jgi:anti-sigma factor RsiW